MAFPFHGWLRYTGGKRNMAGLITERLAVRDAFTSACVGGGSVEIQIATARHLSYLCLADRNPAVRSFYRHGIEYGLLTADRPPLRRMYRHKKNIRREYSTDLRCAPCAPCKSDARIHRV